MAVAGVVPAVGEWAALPANRGDGGTPSRRLGLVARLVELLYSYGNSDALQSCVTPYSDDPQAWDGTVWHPMGREAWKLELEITPSMTSPSCSTAQQLWSPSGSGLVSLYRLVSSRPRPSSSLLCSVLVLHSSTHSQALFLRTPCELRFLSPLALPSAAFPLALQLPVQVPLRAQAKAMPVSATRSPTPPSTCSLRWSFIRPLLGPPSFALTLDPHPPPQNEPSNTPPTCMPLMRCDSALLLSWLQRPTHDSQLLVFVGLSVSAASLPGHTSGVHILSMPTAAGMSQSGVAAPGLEG